MRRDDAWLLDMLLAAREATRLASRSTFAEFQRDRLLQLAIIKSVETVGEAASQVTAATREMHPDIPWSGIVGMRNRLVHAYFDVNLVRVWETVQRDIPQLIAQLEPLVSEEGS